MKTISIQLPDSDASFVQDEVTRGGFGDAGDYLRSLVQQRRSASLRQELEEMLAEADASPSAPLVKADFDEIRRIGVRLLAQRASK